MYYVCGAMEKGDDFMRKMVKNAKDKAEYYIDMKPKFEKYYEEDIDEQISILNQMLIVAKRYDRQELKTELDAFIGDYLSRY